MEDGDFTLIDLEAARNDLSLDTATVLDLMRDFVRTSEDFLVPLRRSLGQGDFAQLRTSAHRLKGVAYNMRADIIGDRALSLERAAETKDEEESARLIDHIEELLDTLGDELRKACAGGCGGDDTTSHDSGGSP
jgi:HPt (histidine-containing phosphotransfer) domain-containing protein